jgi:hypothetical protein
MQREQRLTTLYALTEPDVEIDARSRVRRGSCELGRARQLSAVDPDDSTAHERGHFELLRASRRYAHPALRLADCLQLSPGSTVGQRGASL